MRNLVMDVGRVVVVLSLLAGGMPGCQRSDQTGAYAGVWTLTAGEHVLLVVTLSGPDERLTGTVQRPRSMSTSDGLRFSNVGGGTVSERIVSASPDASAMRIVIEGPDGASDRSTYVMTLDGADRASLVPDGFPFEPWRLTRVRDSQAPQVFEGWQAGRSYSVEDTSGPPNAEMQAIFEADQAARQGDLTPEKLAAMRGGDAERRARTKALVDAGELSTGEDFRRAAFVFQHGDKPEDFLYAHTLATISVVKGDGTAAWIAAATLDRYLNSIGQPQIYGTQFTLPTATGATDATFSEPFNRDLISDALRRQAGVLALEDQLSIMRKSQTAAEKPASPPVTR